MEEVRTTEGKEYLMSIAVLKDSIINGEYENVELVLSSFDLDTLDEDYLDKLLVMILELVAKHKKDDILKLVTEQWAAINPDEGSYSIDTHIYTLEELSDAALEYITDVLKTRFVDIMIELDYAEDAENIRTIGRRLVSLFPREQTIDNYITIKASLEYNKFLMSFVDVRLVELTSEKLREIREETQETKELEIEEEEVEEETEEEEEEEVEEEEEEKIVKEKEEYTQVPEFIITFEGEPPSNEELMNKEPKHIVFKLPDTEGALELVTRGLETYGIRVEEIEQAKEEFRKAYEHANDEERYKLVEDAYINKIREELKTDQELFRIFGPVNILRNANLLGDRPCEKWGGCRALTCLEFENTNDEFEEFEEDPYAPYSTVDWFTGQCDICMKRIEKKCYALRKPLLEGGWIGCYDSFECILNSIDKEDIFMRKIIKVLKDDYLKYGIYDRTYP